LRNKGQAFRSAWGEKDCHQDRSGSYAPHGPQWCFPAPLHGYRRFVTRQESGADFLILAHGLPAFGALCHVPFDIRRFLARQFVIQPRDQLSRIFTHCISPPVS
jgi:hypothetical protein